MLVALSATACVHTAPVASARTRGGCTAVTIDQLWRTPPSFEGRRVCVSGFLGDLIPYGEASPQLFATREEAQRAYSNRYLTIGIPFTMQVQERLSHHSVQPLEVEGVFTLEFPCVFATGAARNESVCEPPIEMRIAHARLTFANGARFR